MFAGTSTSPTLQPINYLLSTPLKLAGSDLRCEVGKSFVVADPQTCSLLHSSAVRRLGSSSECCKSLSSICGPKYLLKPMRQVCCMVNYAYCLLY